MQPGNAPGGHCAAGQLQLLANVQPGVRDRREAAGGALRVNRLERVGARGRERVGARGQTWAGVSRWAGGSHSRQLARTEVQRTCRQSYFCLCDRLGCCRALPRKAPRPLPPAKPPRLPPLRVACATCPRKLVRRLLLRQRGFGCRHLPSPLPHLC